MKFCVTSVPSGFFLFMCVWVPDTSLYFTRVWRFSTRIRIQVLDEKTLTGDNPCVLFAKRIKIFVEAAEEGWEKGMMRVQHVKKSN